MYYITYPIDINTNGVIRNSDGTTRLFTLDEAKKFVKGNSHLRIEECQ